jgi:hypothetical protein
MIRQLKNWKDCDGGSRQQLDYHSYPALLSFVIQYYCGLFINKDINQDPARRDDWNL